MSTTDVKTRLPEVDPSRSRVDELATSARDMAGQLGDESTRLASRVPAAVDAVKAAAKDAAQTVGTMPEPTRLMVASLSLGLGAGLFMSGTPRLLTLIALGPAIAVVGTWMARDGVRPVGR